MNSPTRRAFHHAIGLAAALALAVPSAAANQKSTTSTGDQLENAASDLVNKPLEDANLKQPKIPPVLAKAAAAPYSMAGINTCAQFKAEIASLTAVLGPDVDSPDLKGAGESSTEKMLTMTTDAATSLIPFMGVIRAVSGSNAAKKKFAVAILGGSIRRAYLKGTARGRGCTI